MDGRTYVACDTDEARKDPGVPCEPGGTPADVSEQTVRITKSSGRTVLQVVTTNDVDRAVGIYRTARSHDDKALTVWLVTRQDGPIDVTFCSPELDAETSRDLCG
jgi:hypothetical protein